MGASDQVGSYHVHSKVTNLRYHRVWSSPVGQKCASRFFTVVASSDGIHVSSCFYGMGDFFFCSDSSSDFGDAEVVRMMVFELPPLYG